MAQVFHADPAARPFFKPQLIPRDARIALNQTTLDLTLRPSPKLQGAHIVLKPLTLDGIHDFEAKRHCLLLKQAVPQPMKDVRRLKKQTTWKKTKDRGCRKDPVIEDPLLIHGKCPNTRS